MNLKGKKSQILLFDIYDPIFKWSYSSLMRVFLNHIKDDIFELHKSLVERGKSFYIVEKGKSSYI